MNNERKKELLEKFKALPPKVRVELLRQELERRQQEKK